MRGDVRELLQLLVGTLQLPFLRRQRLRRRVDVAVFEQRQFVSGKQKGENLFPLAPNHVPMPPELHLNAFGRARRGAELGMGQQKPDPLHHLRFAVGLGEKPDRTAFQPFDHIRQINEGGDQEHRAFCQSRLRLDPLAELVAVHLGHVHIADDQRGRIRAHQPERFLAAVRHADRSKMPGKQALQQERLGRTVFDDEDGGFFAH